MIRARGQADRYARALPLSEGWPPFLIVVDVGHVIELYSEFSRSGKTYVPFPDPQSYRIKRDDLADEKIRERLRLVWTDPLALDRAARAPRSPANWPSAWPRSPRSSSSAAPAGTRGPLPDAEPAHHCLPRMSS